MIENTVKSIDWIDAMMIAVYSPDNSLSIERHNLNLINKWLDFEIDDSQLYKNILIEDQS